MRLLTPVTQIASAISLVIAISVAGTPQPARAAVNSSYTITCNNFSRKCTASGLPTWMKNFTLTWWQAIKGGSTTSWGSSVGSALTASMSGTSAKSYQCAIWWVVDSRGGKSKEFAIKDWTVIGNKCP
jgi:hypothetical protein